MGQVCSCIVRDGELSALPEHGGPQPIDCQARLDRDVATLEAPISIQSVLTSPDSRLGTVEQPLRDPATSARSSAESGFQATTPLSSARSMCGEEHDGHVASCKGFPGEPRSSSWRVAFMGGVRLRVEPRMDADTAETLRRNDIFEVVDELPVGDTTFLRLADGRGWALDKTGQLLVCVREVDNSSPSPVLREKSQSESPSLMLDSCSSSDEEGAMDYPCAHPATPVPMLASLPPRTPASYGHDICDMSEDPELTWQSSAKSVVPKLPTLLTSVPPLTNKSPSDMEDDRRSTIVFCEDGKSSMGGTGSSEHQRSSEPRRWFSRAKSSLSEYSEGGTESVRVSKWLARMKSVNLSEIVEDTDSESEGHPSDSSSTVEDTLRNIVHRDVPGGKPCAWTDLPTELAEFVRARTSIAKPDCDVTSLVITTAQGNTGQVFMFGEPLWRAFKVYDRRHWEDFARVERLLQAIATGEDMSQWPLPGLVKVYSRKSFHDCDTCESESDVSLHLSGFLEMQVARGIALGHALDRLAMQMPVAPQGLLMPETLAAQLAKRFLQATAEFSLKGVSNRDCIGVNVHLYEGEQDNLCLKFIDLDSWVPADVECGAGSVGSEFLRLFEEHRGERVPPGYGYARACGFLVWQMLSGTVPESMRFVAAVLGGRSADDLLQALPRWQELCEGDPAVLSAECVDFLRACFGHRIETMQPVEHLLDHLWV